MCAATASPPATAEVLVVELVSSVREAHVQAERGVREALLSAMPEIHIMTITIDAAGSHDAVRRALLAHPSLIVAIGSRAVTAAREATPAAPVVYAMLLDPAGIGLPAPGAARASDAGNITGVTMDVPPGRQFELVRDLAPSARRIGVMYDPALSGDAVRRASAAADRMGLALVLQTVRTEGDALAAARLLAPRVDALWALPDPTVWTAANARALILFSLRARKPLFAGSEGYVRRGAIAAVAADPEAVGRRAGELAIGILRGTAPAMLRPEPPPRVLVFVNEATARHLGITLPRDLLDRAEAVFPRP
jgi:putative ABC transport system substrate-binding protein